jgi:hypothetical protein
MGLRFDWDYPGILAEMSSPPSANSQDVDEIRQRRTKTMLGVWDSFIINRRYSLDRFKLSPPLVNEVIEQYITDRHILKIRYNIPERIQLYKVAGLMTSAIMRFRPIIPLKNNIETVSDIYVNEIFAVYHGLAICGEHSSVKAMSILDEMWFVKWRDEFVYYLHYRNYTAESLCFIFNTLSSLAFPEIISITSD